VLRFRDETPHITSQHLLEFWAVATRPAMENGLGLTVEQAMGQVRDLKRLFALLPETPLQSEWERLVATYRVSGRNSYDARLVAAMMVHGIGSILTFNVQDFTRYAGITVLDPRMVA
jgi:predicted nucleic acid-binding protein